MNAQKLVLSNFNAVSTGSKRTERDGGRSIDNSFEIQRRYTHVVLLLRYNRVYGIELKLIYEKSARTHSCNAVAVIGF